MAESGIPTVDSSSLSPQQETTKKTTRVALGVEYDGSAFHGWQLQEQGTATVQQSLEAGLSAIAVHPVRVICAGRTDTGVHATAQVVHFDTTSDRPERAWVMGTNTRLSPHVRVRWARSVPADFHARFSATARRYIYVIDNQPVKPAIMRRQLSWQCRPLDIDKMRAGAQHLLGKHDFTSFRAAHCQAKSPLRIIQQLEIKRCGDLVLIDIQANAFLHHMVRNIAGVLMAIGYNKQGPEWAKQVLEAQDRTQGGETAPPDGLYLVDVEYPGGFQIPRIIPSLPFLGIGWQVWE